MTCPKIVEDFLSALEIRALQAENCEEAPASLQYSLGYLNSFLLELNLQGYEIELLKRNTQFLKTLSQT